MHSYAVNKYKYEEIQTENYYHCEKTYLYMGGIWDTKDKEEDIVNENTWNLVKTSRFINQIVEKNIQK